LVAVESSIAVKVYAWVAAGASNVIGTVEELVSDPKVAAPARVPLLVGVVGHAAAALTG
jgi:hypothetical protein